MARFRTRLGVPVHALHSGLNDGERARVWAAAARGEARVIVGTRSAVFTPLPNAGLIVVDEEHDGSYKQLDGIRYHARDFALVRAKALGMPVVLGSATPSLESLHNAQAGRYAHLRLKHAPAMRARRRCACWTCASGRCARAVAGGAGTASPSTCRPAARCWCSRTAAATRRCCSATTAAGPRRASAATRR